MRGQVSIEYVMIVGFSLLIIAPMLVVSMRTSDSYQVSIEQTQLQRVADDLTALADEVSFEGAPAARSASVYFPARIENANTTGRFLVLETPTSQIVASASYTNLTWDLEVGSAGKRSVRVRAREHDVIIEDVV